MDAWARSSEAKALHAVINDDRRALREVLADYSARDLRELSRWACQLSDACDELAKERG